MGNIFNKDFLEFIDYFNKSEVKYVLVGGYSVILHGYPRTTGDLDLWVQRDMVNFSRIKQAFEQFRLPLFDMTEENFLDVEHYDVFRFGKQPVAIDIITDLKGLDFNETHKRAEVKVFDGIEICYINYKDLLTAKKASGRPRDINDLENLKKI